MIEEANSDGVARQINRAQMLTYGAKIYFPRRGYPNSSYNNQSGFGQYVTSYNINYSSNGAVGGAMIISVNSASRSELEFLPGVGPVTAGKIISNRLYGSLDELVSRKVLEPSAYGKLKNTLTL